MPIKIPPRSHVECILCMPYNSDVDNRSVLPMGPSCEIIRNLEFGLLVIFVEWCVICEISAFTLDTFMKVTSRHVDKCLKLIVSFHRFEKWHRAKLVRKRTGKDQLCKKQVLWRCGVVNALVVIAGLYMNLHVTNSWELESKSLRSLSNRKSTTGLRW